MSVLNFAWHITCVLCICRSGVNSLTHLHHKMINEHKLAEIEHGVRLCAEFLAWRHNIADSAEYLLRELPFAAEEIADKQNLISSELMSRVFALSTRFSFDIVGDKQCQSQYGEHMTTQPIGIIVRQHTPGLPSFWPNTIARVVPNNAI